MHNTDFTEKQNSLCISKLPRAVLVHIRRVREVLVRYGHVQVTAPEHSLSDVEGRLVHLH